MSTATIEKTSIEDPVWFIDVSGWSEIEIRDLPDWVKVVVIKATRADDFVSPLFRRQFRAAVANGSRSWTRSSWKPWVTRPPRPYSGRAHA